ncbi:unnamed protein product, partial [Brassica rapa subsp. narinosa]
LPQIVEVGRSDGSFVIVEVEYPWTPPICSHCKELGHISRNCPLLPEPPKTAPPTDPQTKPSNPAKLVCYSCKASGHLMKNCPKGPKEWIEVSRRKKLVGDPVENPLAGPSRVAVDTHLPVEDPPHIPSDTEPPLESTPILPPSSPVSMDIDLSSCHLAPASPVPPASPVSPPHLENCILGLAAVCPSRPVIIDSNALSLKKPRTARNKPTSLNPFQILTPPDPSPSNTPPHSPSSSPKSPP